MENSAGWVRMPHLIKCLLAIMVICLLGGCGYLGIESPFRTDPLTGGENAVSSLLLDVRLPAGLQRYPSHGFINNGVNGSREGLETFRGNISSQVAAIDLYNELHARGWEMRLNLRKGDRSVMLYEKGNDLAILTFHRQGVMTVLEIWAGQRLADGALPGTGEVQSMEEPHVELPGEEFGPLDESSEKPGKVEQWGSTLEEREL